MQIGSGEPNLNISKLCFWHIILDFAWERYFLTARCHSLLRVNEWGTPRR